MGKRRRFSLNVIWFAQKTLSEWGDRPPLQCSCILFNTHTLSNCCGPSALLGNNWDCRQGREFQERGEQHSGCQGTPWTLPAVLAFATPTAQTLALRRGSNHRNVELKALRSQQVTSCHLLICF